ncbi:germination protein GerC [Paenibacillus senegalensis]|uniref:germination protein GerC n=1 Tax=Paenibacillus senegalensis TaxID=1465766 RepID=UPI0002892A7D|nr:germination protein GerC [Paenibacillus senegalensis]
MNKRSETLIDRLQHDFKVDTIGYGGLIKAFYPKIWKQIDWLQEYPQADIQITYEYHLRNIGMVNQ